jgi:hypothetical protein
MLVDSPLLWYSKLCCDMYHKDPYCSPSWVLGDAEIVKVQMTMINMGIIMMMIQYNVLKSV